MRQLIFISALFMCTISFSQEMKIKWEDSDGREFSIYAPSGELSYGMLQGDRITYDFKGRVSKVGNTYISYNFNGRVSKVGDVYILFDFNGRLSKVGGLYIQYNFQGRVIGTSGRVN